MGWLFAGVLLGLLLVMGTTVGVHVMPFAPWWFARGDVGSIVLNDGVAAAAPNDNTPASTISPAISAPRIGGVTDIERYGLARAAGFTALDAVTATAISIAEDGTGDPAALSPANRDGSRDLGLWQINSGWWSQFGGQAALEVPSNNAHAAFVIFGRQGWCAWSVYEAKCGPGHTGAYFDNLSRARAAASAYEQ